jgi:heme-degrading protein
VAYRGNAANFGRGNDPMVGGRIGGVNVFGGGLPLYNADRDVIGGLGVSGDSSCADHNVAYRTRHMLELDYVPSGVSDDLSRRDTIVYDIVPQPGQMPGVSPRSPSQMSEYKTNSHGCGRSRIASTSFFRL